MKDGSELWASAFQVWALNGLGDNPDLDEPHIEDDRFVGISVYHGRVYADGVGAILTSFDPQASVVDGGERATGGQLTNCGPLFLALMMAQRFTDRVFPIEMWTRLPQLPLKKVSVSCGEGLVPAWEVGFEIPEMSRHTTETRRHSRDHPTCLRFGRALVERGCGYGADRAD